VNWSANEVALVPLALVTVTSNVPADPPGAIAVIWVAESTVKNVAAFGPNITAVAPVKFVPVSTTLVPPDTGPAFGVIDVTDGGAM